MPLKTWLKTKKKKGQESSALAEDNATNQSPVSDADVTNQEMSSASPARKVANGTGNGLLGDNSCQPLASPAPLPESWRVDFLRPAGPPRDADWWEEDDETSCSRMDLSLEAGDQVNCRNEKGTADDMSLDSQSHYVNGAAAAVCCGVDLDLSVPLSSPPDEPGESAIASPPAAAAKDESNADAAPAVDGALAPDCPWERDDDSSAVSSQDVSTSKTRRRVFRNRGFELWVESRKEWKRYPDAAGKGEAGGSAGRNGTSGRPPASASCGRSLDSAGSSDSSERYGAAALEGLTPVQAEEVLRGLTRVTRTYQLPHKVALPDMVDLLNDIWDAERDY